MIEQTLYWVLFGLFNSELKLTEKIILATKSYDTAFHSQPDQAISLSRIIEEYGIKIARAITGMSDRAVSYHVEKFAPTIPKQSDVDLKLGVLVMEKLKK
ncbi:hypothetical protein M2G66_09180 [Vibrio vulnificus]|nr:hypothetical protein [Vibrio vulnificus]